MTTATLIKDATRLLRPRRPSLREGLLRGAVAGAAGTTALHAVTYLDMALRGRGASSTPEDSVEKLSQKAHLPIPGDEETHHNRVAGLGPLLGIAAGVGTGAALGAVRATGARPPLAVSPRPRAWARSSPAAGRWRRSGSATPARGASPTGSPTRSRTRRTRW